MVVSDPTPPHPLATTPRKVEIQLEIDYVCGKFSSHFLVVGGRLGSRCQTAEVDRKLLVSRAAIKVSSDIIYCFLYF